MVALRRKPIYEFLSKFLVELMSRNQEYRMAVKQCESIAALHKNAVICYNEYHKRRTTILTPKSQIPATLYTFLAPNCRSA